MASACAASSTIAAAAFSSPRQGRSLGFLPVQFPDKGVFPLGEKTEGEQGSTPPPWLDGSLPGDFGFDPLGLASDPESLKWNQQAEIVHCRWAMLGAASIFIPKFLTKIGILNTPSWYTASEQKNFLF
nr:chlorophyll A-B binding protein 7, chloroplastic [Ipomoea batatas]